MEDRNHEGDIRMLVMAVPVVVASVSRDVYFWTLCQVAPLTISLRQCCCIEQRVKLPSCMSMRGRQFPSSN